MNHANLYIVTGASRGLGEAIVRKLLQSGRQILCISRTTNEVLKKDAMRSGASLQWYEMDLGKLAEAGDALSFMESCLRGIELDQLAGIRLINNAGVLAPIGPAHSNDAHEVALHIAVNLTAPMSLTSALLHLTKEMRVDKRIMHISSGAGRKPYAGWSAYCAAKAGLDHFTRCLKLEQDALAYGAKAASIAPGVIDTDMQSMIREAGEERFPSHSRFVEMYESGTLVSPADAASQLLQFLESDEFGDEPVVDIRELKIQ